MYNNKQVNFQKAADGLIPAIVQDVATSRVLMLGYMNQESLDKTLESGKVTFFSRSKQRLWTKGEESGNFLHLQEIRVDCDDDTLLIKARPEGVVCHTGADTCWDEKNISNDFLAKLESIINDRKNNPSDSSYTSKLFAKGINKIAQKVGEEAVEVVIEAKDNDEDLFLNESADLLFHYMVLLSAKGYQLADVLAILEKRHNK
jgi:phosphoribosyl-ATP pyrophosphohydrolase/phosphoribosyl-AMP cyclohydrolase